MPDSPKTARGAGGPAGGPVGGPEYKVYRTRPRLLSRGPRDGDAVLDDLRGAPPGAPPRRRRRISPGRVAGVLAAAVVLWLALSVVLFLVSSVVHGQAPGNAQDQLAGGGVGITSPQTTLILGSDQRTPSTKEPGATTSGPSRSDSIMLLRFGGGHSSKLSIPRDTLVDIPGHGRDKINAAYAFGGAALTIQTIKQFLGIEINHVIEVNFADFPGLIDAMGGIDYTGRCVVSRINGGFKNGGYTLRLPNGTTHIDGAQALALARTRKNECARNEDDRTRARRQQKILSAMKSRVVSPAGFIRMPLIAWAAPKTLQSDMGGPRLLGYAVGVALNGNAPARVLPSRPSPGAGSGLVVSDTDKQAAVARFLR
jgi:LCP family protein required for cell wall assembly